MNNIRVLYHSSIKIEDEKVIYFDPYNIKENFNDADYIFITHDHYDHYSPEDIDKVVNSDTVIFAPESLKEKLSEKNTVIINPNETYKDNHIEILAVPSYNIRKKFHPKENGWNGYVVKLNNISYYIAGDTDFNDDIKNVKCDIAFVPVGGTYTMDYKEASQLINIINPKLVIPTHFGSIAGDKCDGENFRSLINNDIKCEIITEIF